MNNMINKVLLLMVGYALTFSTSVLGATAQIVEKPARVISTLVKTAAIVEAVNKDTRELKLINAQGERFTVVADEAVVNFDQIEPRDRIVTEYLESVAIIVAPAGSEPLIGDVAALEVAPRGDKPGVMGVETQVVVATITALNVADRLATLELENGEIRTIKVSEDARLDSVDVGDQVRLRLTRAVAVNVVKPEH
jgi:hypothetical protein